MILESTISSVYSLSVVKNDKIYILSFSLFAVTPFPWFDLLLAIIGHHWMFSEVFSSGMNMKTKI